MAGPAFRTYFGAQAISAFGSAMSALAVTFAIIGLGASAGELGLVLASGTVPALVLMLVGGVAGDRWERRLIMLGTDLVLAVTMGVLGVLVITGRAEVWHFLVGQLVGGAAMAFTGPASVGLMPSLVPADQLQSANTLRVTSRNVASIAGPPVAGILIATSSAGWALAADGLSFLVSAVLVARLPRSPGHVEAGASVWGDIRHGWSAFTSRRWVVLMVLGFAAYQATVLPAIFVLGPILSEQKLDGAASWALVLSARAAGALVAGLWLLKWRPRRPVAASAAVILLDVPFLLALAAGLPVVVVVLTAAVSSAGVMAADTLWESALQEHVPQDVLSRVSSYDWFGSMMINPLGFALIGAAAAGFGVSPVLLTAVGVTVVVHSLLLVSPSVLGVTRAQPATAPPAPTRSSRSRSILIAEEVRRRPERREDGAEEEHRGDHEAEPDRDDLHGPAERVAARAAEHPGGDARRARPARRPAPSEAQAPMSVIPIVTTPVRNSTTAWSTSIAGAHRATDRAVHPRASPRLEQVPGLADGDHGAGDQHPAGPDRLAEDAALLREGRGLLDRVLDARGDVDPVDAEDAACHLGELLGAHRAGGGVLGADDARPSPARRPRARLRSPCRPSRRRRRSAGSAGTSPRWRRPSPAHRAGCARRRAGSSGCAGSPRAGRAR